MNIAQELNRLQVGNGHSFQNLTVFPLSHAVAPGPQYYTLTEALAAGPEAFQLRELPDGASVPEIEVLNFLELPVLIVEGQELVGARQHRTANVTVLVPAGKTLRLNVSCVEAGRWSPATPGFADAPRTQFAGGRARKVADVSCSMRSTGSRHSDQSAVWDDIARKLFELDVDAPTAAMGAIYEQHVPTLDGYVDAFRALQPCHGAAFAIGGQLIGLDVFDRAETFSKLRERLLRGYAVEALTEHSTSKTAPPERQLAARFLSDLAAGAIESYPAIGLGEDVRMTGRDTVGSALVVEDRIVHLAAFPVKRRRSGGFGWYRTHRTEEESGTESGSGPQAA